MLVRWAALTAAAWLALTLAGCATAPALDLHGTPLPWRDQAFEAPAVPAEAAARDLFVLDADLRHALRAPEWASLGSHHRMERLLTLIFGADRRGFAYADGPSTVAAVTWRQRRGDCLSLAVLTYAAARALGLDAQLQEVEVPPLVDRRGDFDYVARHVNVRVRVQAGRLTDAVLATREVTIDFEASPGPLARRRVLTEAEVRARFHANLGVHFLATGRPGEAHAHLKAAITTDPGYAGAFANLAVLYRDAGFLADAEALLLHAARLSDRPEQPLRTLHALLVQQGRQAEAQAMAARLQARRDSDPYHWLALGSRQLVAGDARAATASLERAQALASGFAELHRLLAVAYWQDGQPERAREQAERLAALAAGDPLAAKLRRKTAPTAPTGQPAGASSAWRDGLLKLAAPGPAGPAAAPADSRALH